MKIQHGFTLIELMVTLAIMAILLGFAVPGLSQLIYRGQLSGAINEFNIQVSTARTEAAMRGRNTYICGSTTGFECDDNWNGGILMWVDIDNDGDMQDNEAKRFYSVNPNQLLIQSNTEFLQFNPRGQRVGANPNFRLTHKQCTESNNFARAISVGVTGRFIAQPLSCEAVQTEPGGG